MVLNSFADKTYIAILANRVSHSKSL